MEVFPKNLEIRLPSDNLSKYIKVYQNFSNANADTFHFLYKTYAFKNTSISSAALM